LLPPVLRAARPGTGFFLGESLKFRITEARADAVYSMLGK